jgi:hypothetical protein
MMDGNRGTGSPLGRVTELEASPFTVSTNNWGEFRAKNKAFSSPPVKKASKVQPHSRAVR